MTDETEEECNPPEPPEDHDEPDREPPHQDMDARREQKRQLLIRQLEKQR